MPGVERQLAIFSSPPVLPPTPFAELGLGASRNFRQLPHHHTTTPPRASVHTFPLSSVSEHRVISSSFPNRSSSFSRALADPSACAAR